MQLTVQQNILKVLKYFDYFKYPLLPIEILHHYPEPISLQEIQIGLINLVANNKIYGIQGFYGLHNNSQQIENRIKGNQLAVGKLKKAIRLAHFLSFFPFVDAAFISGSLSKNYADEHTDIDYFIITRPNKLWIARSILHLFKKATFIVGAQHDFCMNYFIDCKHLELEDKNIYAAIELVTLKAHPKDRHKLSHLLQQNNWTKDFLPNYPNTSDKHITTTSSNKLYHLLFNNICWDKFNLLLMRITNNKWMKKWQIKGFPMEDYDTAFKTRLHVSKNHPYNYQKKVLEYLSANNVNG